jgi:hypothetical protein
VCPKYEECSPFILEIAFSPDCPSYIRKGCNDIGRLSDVRMTPAAYAACVEAFARQSCDDWLYNVVTPAECAPVPGLRPRESACGSPLQCRSGACSAFSDRCGVCTAALPGEGDACFGSCTVGLVCSQGRCVPGRRLGETCNATSECVGIMTCQDGTCARLPGEGEPCAGTELRCDSFHGTSCDAQTGLCEKIPVSGPRETCTGYCRAGAYCLPSGRGSDVCAESRGTGERCPNGLEACDRLHTCTGGVCIEFDPATCN